MWLRNISHAESKKGRSVGFVEERIGNKLNLLDGLPKFDTVNQVIRMFGSTIFL
jgi:hypothetical protein